jgi:plastocyanin
MSRRLALAATLMLAAIAVTALPASAGGGGCYGGVTQGTGTTVFLAEACPTPDILQVEPGATVTFTNKDPFAHNIIGVQWGHYDDLNQGDSFTATFDKPGVYPYACWYHQGMTGAIVVGSGMGAGNGQTVSTAAETVPSPSPVAVEPTADTQVTAARPAATDDAENTVGWFGGGAIGLVLGAGAVLGLRRRRSAAGAEPDPSV